MDGSPYQISREVANNTKKNVSRITFFFKRGKFGLWLKWVQRELSSDGEFLRRINLTSAEEMFSFLEHGSMFSKEKSCKRFAENIMLHPSCL